MGVGDALLDGANDRATARLLRAAFCALLRRRWPALPDGTRLAIVRDLERAFGRDDEARATGCAEHLPLGMDIDRAEWELVRTLWNRA